MQLASPELIQEENVEVVTQPERMAALEERVKNHILFFRIAVVCLCGWLAWLTNMMVDIRTNTRQTATNVQTATAGQSALSVKLEALEARQSVADYASAKPNELKEDLPKLASTLKSLNQRKVKISPSVVSNLQSNLAAIDAKTPDYWPAATEFVSYTSELAHQDIAKLKTTLPRCVDLIPHNATLAEAVSPGEQTVHINPGYYENCQFQIDSPEEDKIISAYAQGVPALTLKHCLISYKGGNIELHLGMWPLTFENCLFEFSDSEEPPSPVQQMTQLLLEGRSQRITFPET